MRELIGLGESQRVERTLATARVFLAVSSLIALGLDPTGPSRFAVLVYGLLIIYVIHSVLILILVRTAFRMSSK